MIQVQNLSKYFGPVIAVDRISFAVGQGEIVGFLGGNGAGKSTTMRILTGYLPATSGIAKVAGYDVMLESTQVRQNIGYLPESVPLYPEMRVDEYITFRAKLKGMTRSDRIRRTEYCLERCRLMTVRRRLLGTLSKGYRQRVGLADAMIANPPIFILDEPTSGLDPTQIRETLALLKELGENHTILLSTHILPEVEAICERVIMIANGRIVLNQRLDEIEADSAILVEARAPEAAMLHALQGIKGIESVKSRGEKEGVALFEIRTLENQDLREVVGHTIATKGWSIRRLERKSRSLENAFFEAMHTVDPLQFQQQADAKATVSASAPATSAAPASEAITEKQ